MNKYIILLSPENKKRTMYFQLEKNMCVYKYEKWKLLSRVWLFLTPWTIQSMEFSRP